jgi:hypothetical protein
MHWLIRSGIRGMPSLIAAAMLLGCTRLRYSAIYGGLFVICMVAGLGCADYGAPAGIILNPASVDFGDVGVGSCKYATITILNNLRNGPDTLFVRLDSGAFSLYDTTHLSKPLLEGREATIMLSFCPNAEGSFQNNLLIVSSAGFGSPKSVFLKGIGK